MRLSLILLLLVSYQSSAQIIVSIGDFADADDTVRMSTAQVDPGIDFLSTGQDHTWNFSSLVAVSQELKHYKDLTNASFLVDFIFGSFAAPNYQASNFVKNDDLPVDQLSQVLPITISEVNLFSKVTVDSITSIGFSMNIEGNEVPIKSDTIETRYKFPLYYQDAYESRGYTYMDMNPIYNAIWIQHRHRNTIVDGWGSITTPYGTFDVLRVNHTINESDSVFMEIFSVPTWIELPVPPSHIYEWIALGEKEPILRITTNDLFGTETVTNIEYRDQYLGLDASLEELQAEYSLYPNPTSDNVTITGLDHSFSYIIYNQMGEKLSTGTASEGTEISLAGLAPGSYFLYLTDGKYKSISPVIKD